MLNWNRTGPGASTFFVFAFCLALGAELHAAKWKPVTPEELGRKAPVVEKAADAEALFWDVQIEDGVGMLDGAPSTTYTNYVRLKIYTEKGRSDRATVEIPFSSPDRVRGIAGRTIRADGSETELDAATIREKTLVKAGRRKWKAKTFTLPAVEPGVVVEYQWVLERPGRLMLNVPIQVQQDVPIEVFRIAFHPLQIPRYSLFVNTFGFPLPPFSDAKGGFRASSVANVPSLREEPHSPPDGVSRWWMLVSYTDVPRNDVDAYWKEIGKRTAAEAKKYISPSRTLRKVAAEVAGAEGVPLEQLRKLFDHCRSKVKNIDDPLVVLPSREREAIEAETDPDDVLAKGAGTPRQINLLFAALAASAGFDVRLARVGDRREMLFHPGVTNDYFLSAYDVAVKVNGEWSLFDPGTTQVPFGALLWYEEGQKALVCDSKESLFVDVPAILPEWNRERRKAELTLSADGTLEGTVRIELTGHRAVARRLGHGAIKADEREKELREELARRLPGAELSGLEVENLGDPEVPLVVKYGVRIPSYATRVGRRLLLAPSFFQRGVGPRLAASERRSAIWFPTGALEEDEVRITLPAGLVAEDLSWPAPFQLGVGDLYSASVSMDGGAFVYKRSLKVGSCFYEPKIYPALRQVFGNVATQDGRELALVPAAGGRD